MLTRGFVFSLLIAHVASKAGGGGRSGSKSSKRDRVIKNQNHTQEFTFLLVQQIGKMTEEPPLQENHSAEFDKFVDKAWSVMIGDIAYYYLPDNHSVHEYHQSVGEPVICLHTLVEEDVPEHPNLANHPVLFECELINDNETEVVCCETKCCVTRYTEVTYLGKGAFTLVIFSLIGLIIILSMAWIYYSKTQEIKKRRAEAELFESRKIKNKKTQIVPQISEPLDENAEKLEAKNEKLVTGNE